MDELTAAQRTCGDVLDRLPCVRCGATTLKQCTLGYWERAQATQLINATPGLYQRLITANDRAKSALTPNQEEGS